MNSILFSTMWHPDTVEGAQGWLLACDICQLQFQGDGSLVNLVKTKLCLKIKFQLKFAFEELTIHFYHFPSTICSEYSQILRLNVLVSVF